MALAPWCSGFFFLGPPLTAPATTAASSIFEYFNLPALAPCLLLGVPGRVHSMVDRFFDTGIYGCNIMTTLKNEGVVRLRVILRKADCKRGENVSESAAETGFADAQVLHIIRNLVVCCMKDWNGLLRQ